MPTLESFAGAEFVPNRHGRAEVKPRPPVDVLRELVPLVRATVWPDDTATSRLPGPIAQLEDLAYAATVRGVALLTLLARGTEPDERVLKALRYVPQLHYVDEPDDSAYVWMEPTTLLRDEIAPGLPEPVRELLQGRIRHALRDWPACTAEVCGDLAGSSGPLPVDGESLANRHHGARVSAALYASYLGVAALRWPIAAAWSVNELLYVWLDWADNVVAAARVHTAGLAPYGGTGDKYDAPLPEWADVVTG